MEPMEYCSSNQSLTFKPTKTHIFHRVYTSILMRSFSVLELFALVTWVVAIVPESIVSCSTLIEVRTSSPSGRANFYGDDQHTRLYSGGVVLDMWVPTTDAAYNVGKPSALLNCNEVSSPSQLRDPACAECWSRVDHVEILTPGPCSFALTDDNQKLFTMTTDHTKGKYPFPVPGYLALVTCHRSDVKATRDVDHTQFSCMETHGSTIATWTGQSEYILRVPANGTVFDVIGPDSRLGSIGPVGTKHAMCQACNFPIQTLILSSETGTCAFNLSGYADLVYHNSNLGPLSLPSPTQIWTIECGLNHLPVDLRDVLSESQSAPIEVVTHS